MKFSIHKNPNIEEYNEITEAVELNQGYCPCALERSSSTKCMCKEFREQKEVGFCHCGRFYKIPEYESLAVVSSLHDEDDENYLCGWLEQLGYQDFIVYDIIINPYDYRCHFPKTTTLHKTKIAKADAVIFLTNDIETEEIAQIVQTLMDWARSLNKRILTRSDLLNENRENQSL